MSADGPLGTNATESSFVNSTESPAYEFTDYTQRVVVATLILVVFVVGTIGNILSILAVYLSKKLRLPVFVFVVNLSVADLLTCVIYPWDAVALLGKDGLPVGEWVCGVQAIIKFTTIGCSICTLASIGLNRLLLIKRTSAHQRLCRSRNALIVWIVIIWLFPFLVLLIPPLLDIGAVGFNQQYHFCGSKSTHPLFNIYNLIRVMALFPIPLVLLIISFVFICMQLQCRSVDDGPRCDIELEEHATVMLKLETTNGTSPPEDCPTSVEMVGASSFPSCPGPMDSQQIVISKTILFVMGGFIVCLTPYAVLIFLKINAAIPYTNVLLYSNSCINPIIYAATNRDFRTIFGCILRRRWDQIP